MDIPTTGNPRRDLFCDEWAVDRNGAQAAIRAGYSPKGAEVQASRLLTDDKVRARINALVADRTERLKMSADEVLIELAKLARANMADYMSVGPNGDPVLNWSKLTRDQAAALQEVAVDDYMDGRGEEAREVRRVRFKLIDKRGALVDLGKHLGLFPTKTEISGPGGDAIPVAIRRVIVDADDS